MWVITYSGFFLLLTPFPGYLLLHQLVMPFPIILAVKIKLFLGNDKRTPYFRNCIFPLRRCQSIICKFF